MNKSRKYNKSKKIWDYHYYKKSNYIKAINSYLRCLKLRSHNDGIYLLLSQCYKYIWKSEKALLFINKWLYYSSWNYDIIKFKWDILLDLWKNKEAKIFLDKIKILDDVKNNYKLDLDAFYNKK